MPMNGCSIFQETGYGGDGGATGSATLFFSPGFVLSEMAISSVWYVSGLENLMNTATGYLNFTHRNPDGSDTVVDLSNSLPNVIVDPNMSSLTIYVTCTELTGIDYRVVIQNW